MLDELMGKERDVPLGKRQNKALQFDDKDICKYELVALCPNRLFRNTKSDLGEQEGKAAAPQLISSSSRRLLWCMLLQKLRSHANFCNNLCYTTAIGCCTIDDLLL